MRFRPGDSVVTNEKVQPLPGVPKSLCRVGIAGVVLDVAFENHRKNKQWVLVLFRGKQGNKIGQGKLPSNWLSRV